MIEINNLTAASIDEKFLKGVAEIVLKDENRKETELSITLVGQGRIKALNKKYLGKNRATDVLAFGQNQTPNMARPFGPPSPSGMALPSQRDGRSHRSPPPPGEGGDLGTKHLTPNLGEVVICLREVKKNAKRFGSSFKKELARVLIHGILHLFGYGHERLEKGEKMKEKEEYYLTKLNL